VSLYLAILVVIDYREVNMLRNKEFTTPGVRKIVREKIAELRVYQSRFAKDTGKLGCEKVSVGYSHVESLISEIETNFNVITHQSYYLYKGSKRFSLKKLERYAKKLEKAFAVPLEEHIEETRKKLTSLRYSIEKQKERERQREQRIRDEERLFKQMAHIDLFNLRRCQMRAALKIAKAVHFRRIPFPGMDPQFKEEEQHTYNRVIQAAKEMANRLQAERITQKKYRETDLKEQSIEDFIQVA